jgi:hypothetical protein
MTRVVVLAALAACLVATGCSGGGKGRVTKSDYESEVGSIAVRLTEAVQEVGAASTVKSTVAALRRCRDTFVDAADEMEAITPPKDIEREHRQLTAAVRNFGQELDPIIERVAKGNRLAVMGVQALPGLMQIVRASADIGQKGYDLGGSG